MTSDFTNYTKEELQKKYKKQRIFTIIHGFIVFLLFVVAGFSFVEKGISIQTFLPLFFIPMEVLMILELKKIGKELKKRP